MHIIKRMAMAGMLLSVAGFTSMRGEILRAVIPFEFEANGQTLPAGKYELAVDRLTYRATLTPPSGLPIFLGAQPQEWKGNLDQGAVTFHRYGNVHYLHAWKAAGTRDGYLAPLSKGEKAAARRGVREVAMLLVQP